MRYDIFGACFVGCAMLSALAAGAEEPVRQDARYLSTEDYFADPAAHVFNGKTYVYTSHDWDSPVKDGADGAHHDMKD